MHDEPTDDVLAETQAAARSAANLRDPKQLAALAAEREALAAEHEAAKQRAEAEAAGPRIVVDGRELDGTEVQTLLEKDINDLTDAEREALQPLVEAAQQQRLDPLAMAGQVLVDAYQSLYAKPANAQPLREKIALGQALANLAEAQIARAAQAVNQQMAQLHLRDRQASIAKAAGPSGIVVPAMMPNGRG